MPKKPKRPTLEIDWETLDGIIVGWMRGVIKTTRKYGDSPNADKEIIDACKRLLRYCGDYGTN